MNDLVLLLILLWAPAQGEEERRLRSTYQDSCVSFRSGDVWGHGILLNDKGIILVNAISATSATTYDVAIRKAGYNGPPDMFKASLVAIHPTQELALLQVQSWDAAFKAVPAARTTSAPSAGEAVWAMGPAQPHPGTVSGGSGPPRHLEYFLIDFPPAGSHPFALGDVVMDRQGRIAGMATLGVVNGEVKACMIPLHDLRISEFVAPGRRPPDYIRAREHLQVAEEIQNPKNDDLRIRYYNNDIRPDHLLRLALIDDPKNPEIHYRLGLYFVAKGYHEGAVHPLIQSLQFAPWSDFSNKAYLQLGISLSKTEKRRNDALAVLKEGVAKFPTNTPALWEALAREHFDTGNFVDAARCSSAALATFGSDAGAMKDIYEKSKLRLSDSEQGELRSYEGGLPDRLRRMAADAEAAKKESREFLTPEGERVFTGLQRGAAPRAASVKAPLTKDGKELSDKEVATVFVQTRITVASEHLRSGRLDLAVSTLEDLIKAYPDHPDTQTARDYLALIKARKK
jgi:tetratricopeptide (TPR) repeat protein